METLHPFPDLQPLLPPGCSIPSLPSTEGQGDHTEPDEGSVAAFPLGTSGLPQLHPG